MKFLILFGLLAVVFGIHSPYFSVSPEAIRQGFVAVDFNHDGFMTLNEVQEFSKKRDLNGDGFVSYTEYKLSQPQKTPNRIVRGQFKYYDKLDGEIDDKISPSGDVNLMNILDTNKNGEVTLEEFEENMPKIVNGIIKEIDALVLIG
ncbi:uncharacterized protein LOC112569340 isoform X1 [Pomacea canaliculata]|uniref:uncharacterized protein LOC112569340 isoform X1 n=1 Tax=Pomacea canaliculata TaxID=400727 RepID=UPI000D732808|nr:uncharacterized protein LOC112569340 isoform X1 [Pomacea canaliculata]